MQNRRVVPCRIAGSLEFDSESRRLAVAPDPDPPPAVLFRSADVDRAALRTSSPGALRPRKTCTSHNFQKGRRKKHTRTRPDTFLTTFLGGLHPAPPPSTSSSVAMLAQTLTRSQTLTLTQLQICDGMLQICDGMLQICDGCCKFATACCKFATACCKFATCDGLCLS